MFKTILILSVGTLLVGAASMRPDGSDYDAADRNPEKQDQADRLLIRKTTNVGLDLHRRIIEDCKDQNVALSPYSLSALLGMAAAGAHGQTRAELNRLLSNDEKLSDKKLLQTYSQLSKWAIEDNDHILSAAQMMYPASDCQVRDEFRQVIRETFKGKIQTMDFASRQTTKDKINEDISRATHGKISQFFGQNSPNSDARMILASAIHFKGKWVTKFQKADTQEADFHDKDGIESRGKVQLMNYRAKVEYTHSADLQAAAVRLPYQDSNAAMIVLLPDRGERLTDLQKKITGDKLNDLTRSFAHRNVKLWLPRFTVQSTHDGLEETVKGLGARNLFSDQADFSGITGVKAERALHVSSIIQKAVVEVNEEGTEAASASGMIERNSAGGRPQKEDITFRADRPFLYVIVSEVALRGGQQSGSNQVENVPLISGQFVQPR